MASTQPGRELLHYRLADKIGEGGMGVVWRAVDTHLDREVAIKVLPAQLAEDVERLARLEREAKLLASLNHPNICGVFGLEEANGTRFLVMELVPGEDLSQRLARGRLSVEETLDVCGQIAGALEAAHDQGVVHRDLKPANVRVTSEGVVKVLDFGLARPASGPSVPGDLSVSPTITAMTGSPGSLLGTASYMSPEQARTQPVDRRTDVWALGCVMYECLTGRRAFRGDTVSDSLAEILKSTPDWSALPGGTPPRLRELIERCLIKDPRERQRDAGDVRLALRRIARLGVNALGETGIGRPGPAGKTLVAVGAGALVAGALLGFGLWKALTPPPSPAGDRVSRLSISIPEGQRVERWFLSPDGSHLAYRASVDSAEAPSGYERTLFVRPLGAYEPRPVENSHGVRHAAFSPDGRWLAFLAHESPGSTRLALSKVPVDGSAPALRLAEWSGDWNHDFVWSSEKRLVTTGLQSVIQIAADGSGAHAKVNLRQDHRKALLLPEAPLPDGRNVLCDALSTSATGFHHDVVLLDAEAGQARTLIVDGASPRWTPSGQLLFTRRDALLAVPFDARSLEIGGSPRTITRGLGGGKRHEGAPFDLSRDGTLVYQPGGVVGGNRRLAWISPDGTVEDWSATTRPLGGLKASADGRWISVQIIGKTGHNDEVWVADAAQPPLRRLFAEEGQDCLPGAISLSGRVAALCGEMMAEVGGIHVKDIRGGGDSTMVVGRKAGEYVEAVAFTTDETRLIYLRWLGEKKHLFDIPLQPADDGGRPERLLVRNVVEARLSPDGRWLAYVSDSTERPQAYLRSYEPLGGLGPEIPITSEGASSVRWSPTGVEGRYRLFFAAAGGQFQSLTIDSKTMARLPPRQLHPELSERLRDALDYQPISDRWLAVLRGEDERPPDELHVVLNWTANL